jgi:hypothetical protein
MIPRHPQAEGQDVTVPTHFLYYLSHGLRLVKLKLLASQDPEARQARDTRSLHLHRRLLGGRISHRNSISAPLVAPQISAPPFPRFFPHRQVPNSNPRLDTVLRAPTPIPTNQKNLPHQSNPNSTQQDAHLGRPQDGTAHGGRQPRILAADRDRRRRRRGGNRRRAAAGERDLPSVSVVRGINL